MSFNSSFAGFNKENGGGGSGVNPGTPNYLAKYNASGNNIQDSAVYEDGLWLSNNVSAISGILLNANESTSLLFPTDTDFSNYYFATAGTDIYIGNNINSNTGNNYNICITNNDDILSSYYFSNNTATSYIGINNVIDSNNSCNLIGSGGQVIGVINSNILQSFSYFYSSSDLLGFVSQSYFSNCNEVISVSRNSSYSNVSNGYFFGNNHSVSNFSNIFSIVYYQLTAYNSVNNVLIGSNINTNNSPYNFIVGTDVFIDNISTASIYVYNFFYSSSIYSRDCSFLGRNHYYHSNIALTNTLIISQNINLLNFSSSHIIDNCYFNGNAINISSLYDSSNSYDIFFCNNTQINYNTQVTSYYNLFFTNSTLFDFNGTSSISSINNIFVFNTSNIVTGSLIQCLFFSINNTINLNNAQDLVVLGNSHTLNLNLTNNVYESFIAGHLHNLDINNNVNAYRLINIGYNNTIQNTLINNIDIRYNLILGYQCNNNSNYFTNSVGYLINISRSSNVSVFGQTNTISNVYNAIVVGNANTLSNEDNSVIYGNNNSISNTTNTGYKFIFGGNNLISNSNKNIINIGYSNQLNSVKDYTFIAGIYNNVSNSNVNYPSIFVGGIGNNINFSGYLTGTFSNSILSNVIISQFYGDSFTITNCSNLFSLGQYNTIRNANTSVHLGRGITQDNGFSFIAIGMNINVSFQTSSIISGHSITYLSNNGFRYGNYISGISTSISNDSIINYTCILGQSANIQSTTSSVSNLQLFFTSIINANIYNVNILSVSSQLNGNIFFSNVFTIQNNLSSLTSMVETNFISSGFNINNTTSFNSSNIIGNRHTINKALYNHIFGSNLVTRSVYETVFGNFNADYAPVNPNDPNSYSDGLFIFGGGTNISNRRNVMFINKGGDVAIAINLQPLAKLHVRDTFSYTKPIILIDCDNPLNNLALGLITNGNALNGINTSQPHSNLHVNGSISESKIFVLNSTAYSIIRDDYTIFVPNAFTGANITLPNINVNGIQVGKKYEIIIEPNTIINISSSAGDTINGLSSISVSSGPTEYKKIFIKAININSWVAYL